MGKGLNKVMIIGNLGADPEMRYTADGSAVANLSIATSEQWKDKHSGQAMEKTEWHRIVAFRRLAEIMGEYLYKGAKVYIEGRLQTRKWQDQQGQERYTTEIICDQMQILTAREGGNAGSAGSGEQRTAREGGNAGSTGSGGQRDTNHHNPQHRQNPATQRSTSSTPNMDFDDDIPF